MRVFGVDPGLRFTGYGCVEVRPGSLDPALVEGGVIKLNDKKPVEDRLLELDGELTALLQRMEPQRVAVEKVFSHYAHPTTAVLMGHARGVILLAAKRAGCTVIDLPATEVKKSVTGHGHASKQQVQLAVAGQLGLAEPPEPADVADALAIALCHARRVALDRLR